MNKPSPKPPLSPLPPVLIPLVAILACGCTIPRPLKGGHATTTGTLNQTLAQGDNPSQPSSQAQETVKVRTYTLPPGTRIEQSSLQTANISPIPSHSSHSVSNAPTTIILAAPTPVVEREETHARTELGAAQKDTARELGAKLSSLKSIVWVGIALFIFGLASFAWPPLKLIIGSVTTSAAITLGGIALMILPTLIVGNELLILGGVVVAVGAWCLAHRHGHLRGLLSSSVPAPGTPAPNQRKSAKMSVPNPAPSLRSL